MMTWHPPNFDRLVKTSTIDNQSPISSVFVLFSRWCSHRQTLNRSGMTSQNRHTRVNSPFSPPHAYLLIRRTTKHQFSSCREAEHSKPMLLENTTMLQHFLLSHLPIIHSTVARTTIHRHVASNQSRNSRFLFQQSLNQTMRSTLPANLPFPNLNRSLGRASEDKTLAGTSGYDGVDGVIMSFNRFQTFQIVNAPNLDRPIP
uniref:Uncharacterized protein n=1 Tax=Brassica oleracea var. oleracea TaxID=109376 RepID=A0A0D3CNY2_BRAOL